MLIVSQQIVWARFYNTSSILDKGTLYNLQNVVNRRNVSASVDDDFNACEDFFKSVMECHVVAAAMHHLKMCSLSNIPCHAKLQEDLWLLDDDARRDILIDICMEIVFKFAANFLQERTEANEKDETEDKVHCYATELLSYGMLYNEFADAIREGDGNRTIRCWRYFLLFFKAHKRKNYSTEALHLLSQLHFFLSPRQSQQLMWSRFINTHGIEGRNIAADLYMEHLNRVCKNAVANLSSNITPSSFKRVGKCVGTLKELLESFDKEFNIATVSGKHAVQSSEKDCNLMLKQLLEENVFEQIDGKSHNSFCNIDYNLLRSIKEKPLQKWMVEKINEFRKKLYV